MPSMLPARVLPLFDACRSAGGRALLVGGTVRDALLGRPGKDLDVEVHGIGFDELLAVLQRFGRVDEVGRSFHVLKLKVKGVDLDVSVPRRDRKAGAGHRGIAAEADPFLGVLEAARRRDLTINAIAYDPLMEVYEDPFGGRSDLDARLLRAVDADTFGEDPLRALRVAQFAGRFGFDVDPALFHLAASMPLAELPAERIRGEIEKLFLKAPWPNVGWNFAYKAGLWAQVLPEWHHSASELDRLGADAPAEPGRRLALMYSGACRQRHAAEAVLDRLRVFRHLGYDVRKQVFFLLDAVEPSGGVADAFAFSETRCRRLAEQGELELLSLYLDAPELRLRAIQLGVLTRPLPPLLIGRDLLKLGFKEGPELGRMLARLREAQLDGLVMTADEARRWLFEGASNATTSS